MDDAAALAEIRRAAKAALDAWPEARAAVLFGSRARGNHRPDSDWDVAFIVRGDGERLGRIPSNVHFSVPGVQRRHYVNEIAIPEQLVARKALCIGHVGRGIVCDGRILAGEWSRPKPEGAPFMETEKYERSIGTSLDMIEVAVSALALLGLRDDWDQCVRRVDRYVACTADAAERLAKAILGRHRLDARHSHDLHLLADQARKSGHEALAEDFMRMNGATQDDHKARYEGTDADSLSNAVSRLPVILELIRKELAAISVDFLDPHERRKLANSAASICADGAAALRSAVERDGPNMQPPEPHVWIAPLIRSREALAAALDEAGDALGSDAARAETDDWQPPEPSPLGEDPWA